MLNNFLTTVLWTFLVRVLGAGLMFVSVLLFARLLGPSEFGIYSLSLTVITIASVISRWGLDNVILKQVATYLSESPQVANGYVLSAVFIIVTVGLPISIVFWFFSDYIAEIIFSEPELSFPLSVMAWAIVPTAIIFVIGEAFKAYGKPVYATFLQTVLAPSITLLIVGTYWFLGFMSLTIIVYSVTLGFIGTLIFHFYSWIKVSYHKGCVKQTIRSIASQGWPMLLISSGALVMSWSDTIILGIYSEIWEVGIYSAASRVVMVTSLVLIAVNSITAPKYARYYQEGKFANIAELAQTASIALLLIVSIPSVILVFFPEWVMSWFGLNYIAGANILIILAIGQLVNVTCGSVGYLLSMTGKEHKFRDIMLMTALINIVLSIVFVQDYGALGVAYATAFSIILWNIWTMYEVKKHLGFWTFNPIRGFKFRS